ncbi:hypothetical protein DPM19_21145 [Actinomadura craniellae]|uniref:DUF2877 domain-containing protein n=1 Tax=Actinomadura craniellae TaxID=2231787 RepID=A0A365H2A7_9ACTN|nr:hypothetical protein DPM19_21145 [Actinomadura craniellae]
MPAPSRSARGEIQRPHVPGAASEALRGLLDRPRCAARVIAVFPAAIYLQLRTPDEPRVLAVVSSDAVRLPNSVVVAAGSRERPFGAVREGDEAEVGDGCVEITAPGPSSAGRLRVRTRRWWNPTPALGVLPLAGLARSVRALEGALPEGDCGLAGHPGPKALADRCAAGDLAHAVDAAERIVGLGPGLTPSGDDVLAGLLVSLRLVGSAVGEGGTAVWLADWLGAAVTAHADTRTTSLAATLLHCAARGQAGAEVAAVLRAVAGHEPMEPAVRRLLAAGHTSGADLAWGLLAGCRATLALATAAADGRRVSA